MEYLLHLSSIYLKLHSEFISHTFYGLLISVSTVCSKANMNYELENVKKNIEKKKKNLLSEWFDVTLDPKEVSLSAHGIFCQTLGMHLQEFSTEIRVYACCKTLQMD